MCFADSNQGAVSAAVFNAEFQGKKVGVFYQSDNDYSKGIFTQFMANIDDSFDVVEASFTESTSTEFTAQVNTLKDCDVIFMPIYYTPASTFMKQGIGIIKDDATYYGCDGLDGIDTIDGFDISTVPQKVSYLSHFNSMEAEGAAATYIANYKEKFGDKAPLNQFGAAAYDCVYAIYEAMKVAVESGKTIDAKTSASDVCDALTEVFNGDFVFHGITGKPTSTGKSDITWDDGGYVNKTAVSYTVKEVTTK
jgi:branched-chain amino acid transport system substrate-binding protein